MSDAMNDDLGLLIDLHQHAQRQGPGGDAETCLAIALSGLATGRALRIADIGCGTGASTLVLARELDARITAVDFLPEFLEVLGERARRAGLGARITTCAAAMDVLPLEQSSLDAIWSEGAIYNIGFERGVREWRRFLKPGGILAVSELTWFTAERPQELDSHWRTLYAEVDTAAAKFAVLERQGYAPLGYFVLPEACWLEGYYQPLRQRFPAFLAAHHNSEEALAVVAAEEVEIALYERFRQYYGYGFYVARKTGDQ